jgi:hypothetical protein
MSALQRFGGGRAVRRKPGEMNRLEAQYATYLEGLKHGGDVVWYEFDAVKLRLAASTFYTPDFIVVTKALEVEVREVKGHWEDDARVKIKVAADKYPFRFVGITRKGGEWIEEKF